MELSRTLSVTEGSTEEAEEYNAGKDNPVPRRIRLDAAL